MPSCKNIAIVFISLFLLEGCQTDTERPTLFTVDDQQDIELFELVDAAHSKLTFTNRIEENFQNFFAQFNYVYNGAGVAIGDIDNDGLSDIYFTGNDVPNKLYLNTGNLTFNDITETAGVSGGKGWHNGTVMADVNGDGLLDIYVCRGGYNDLREDRTNLLFINQGNATFKEEAFKYGLDDDGYSLMASFFDADNDNDLDLYVTNRPNTFFLNYQQVLSGKKKEEDSFRDKLYLQENGKFQEVGKKSGIRNNFGYGLGLATTDINSDGRTDIMVSNDYLEKDYLYLNQGKGQFKEQLAQHFNHIPFYAMGIDVVDFNNDGFEDIIQLEMMPEDYERSKTTMASMNTTLFRDMTTNGFHYQYMHNQFHLNRGDGNFSEIALFSGIAKTDWSWACLGSDFDNDGYRDIFITNGFKRDIWDKDANSRFQMYMRSPEFRQSTNEQKATYIINLFQENKIPNYLYKNNGDLTFSKKTMEWGMNQPSFSGGAAVGDLDNDGDLDVVVNNIDESAFLYENKAEQLPHHYLKIKLKGPKNNPTGLGAKVTLKYGDQLQFHEFKTVRGYLSSVEPLLHFGLGTTTRIETCEIVWGDGKKQTLKEVAADQLLKINYQEAKLEDSVAPKRTTLFSETTSNAFITPFIHQENEYDDFKKQILLPHKLSQNGPCLPVGDVNNDKLEDLYIGGAANQPGVLYLQTINEIFKATTQKAFEIAAFQEDVGSLFFDADGDLDLDLYVVSGGNEFAANSSAFQDRLYLNDGNGNFSGAAGLPNISTSGSCVISLDFDDDGDLDLFIGGRLIPDKYPFSPRSYLLENKKGIFEDVTDQIAPQLGTPGMVTSAVWSNIDGDDTKALILVGEWMPISIFEKQGDTFVNATSDYNLEKTSGWWNKIVAADLDKDGDMDFVVGNMGLNYKIKPSQEKPFVVYADDFDKNGTNDIFLAQPYKDREVPVRGWQCTAQQMPDIGKKFKSYTEFAKADIQDLIGNTSASGLRYEVQEFASVILENRDGELVVKRLPAEAQFSAINGIVINDFDKDGIEDILIAGNKFEVEVETTRADASIGLVLLGSTSGTYQPTNYLKSGYFVRDNVRNVEAVKMANGSLGILTGINDGPLKIHTQK